MPFERKPGSAPMDKKAEKLILGYIASGLSQKEACFLANIPLTTWRDYKDRHGLTKEFMDMIKRKPSMKAKMVVVKDIEEGNPASAKWWLEHKESQEFNTKVVQDVTVAPILSMEDKEKALREYMEKIMNLEDGNGQSGRPSISENAAGVPQIVDERASTEALQEVYDS